MDFNSIDWNSMWQEEAGQGHWNDFMSREAHWDKRAATFTTRVNRDDNGRKISNDYISNMLTRIEVRPEWTVLDIGSGPGTLALPLAEKAAQVTALDISGKMLERLSENAEQNGQTNITCLKADWQEAFAAKALEAHDVVVASRVLMSGNMRTALEYIDSITRQAAYLTFPIVHLPFDFEIYGVIGRGQKKHPPFIYIYNMLFQMGIHANVEILYSAVKVRFAHVQDAIDDLQWRTDPFTREEKSRIREYLVPKFAALKNTGEFIHEGKSRWALIWWSKGDNKC